MQARDSLAISQLTDCTLQPSKGSYGNIMIRQTLCGVIGISASWASICKCCSAVFSNYHAMIAYPETSGDYAEGKIQMALLKQTHFGNIS